MPDSKSGRRIYGATVALGHDCRRVFFPRSLGFQYGAKVRTKKLFTREAHSFFRNWLYDCHILSAAEVIAHTPPNLGGFVLKDGL